MPFNVQDLIKYSLDDGKRMTKQFEGKGKAGRPFYAYEDTKDNPTIGYGTLISGTGDMLSKDVREGNEPIAEALANQLFNADYINAIEDARQYVGNETFNALKPHQQKILVDMAYNLGLTKLGGFEKMHDNMLKGNDTGTRREMKDSDWFEQVGDRSKHHYNTY